MENWLTGLVALGALAMSSGCAGASPGASAPLAQSSREASPASASPAERFKEALAALAKHDAAGDWNEAACAKTARLFLEAGEGRLALARYDAGIAYQRCGNSAEARVMFEAATLADPELAEARVALALLDAASAQGRGDFTGAQRRLSAALMADSGSVALLNQLALAYLAGAKAATGADRAAVIELARKVCERAIGIEPRNAAVHNTLGLIEARLRGFDRAAAAFDKARQLDPSLLEAHMNAGSIRLRTGAYAASEDAYRTALRLRAGDYDARIGLALAIRARLDMDSDGFEARLKEAMRELEAAIASAPGRPEAYLNQAVLLLLEGRFGGAHWQSAIPKAQRRLREILAIEGQTPQILRAKEVAKLTLEDLSDALDCKFNITEKERKQEEERARVRMAQDYLNADIDGSP